MTLRLPEEKLKALILGWLGKKVTVARDLKSLGGKLEHACRVVRPGRSFMRRMLDLLSGVKFSHRHIRLSASFHSDLMWWHLFPVIMEWSIDGPVGNLDVTGCCGPLRCVRLVGLCSMVERGVVHLRMASRIVSKLNNTEGNITNCAGLRGVGSNLEVLTKRY